jgi:hypothetical protein
MAFGLWASWVARSGLARWARLVARLVFARNGRMGRGAFWGEEGVGVTLAGATRSANAGMSSEKAREKRVRRKPKVSDGR